MGGGVSAIPEQNQALEQQLKLAEQLRQGPAMPKGETIPEHSVYVGPNAMQSAAAALHQGLAMHRGNQYAQQMMANAGKQQDARTAMMQAIAQAIRPNMPGQSAQVPGAPQDPNQLPQLSPEEMADMYGVTP
jgi:hypothetical protein